MYSHSQKKGTEAPTYCYADENKNNTGRSRNGLHKVIVNADYQHYKAKKVIKLRMLQLYHRMLYALLFRAAAASIFRLFQRKIFHYHKDEGNKLLWNICTCLQVYTRVPYTFTVFPRVPQNVVRGGSTSNRGIKNKNLHCKYLAKYRGMFCPEIGSTGVM
jgi:hypothetical protein